MTSAISDIFTIMGSALTFVTGNTWLVVLVAAPIAVGILGAIISAFRS